MDYPKMLYRDGKLTDEHADTRVVNDEEAELAASADGFTAHVPADAEPAAEPAAKAAKAKGPGK